MFILIILKAVKIKSKVISDLMFDSCYSVECLVL